jgi:sigma-B regulation protein RsbU (phosphoserine phosphatase)
VLHRVNRQLYPDIKEDMFISMVYMILDAHESDIRMARAGHDPPLLYRAATGKVESLNPKGMALGIDSGEVFDRVCADFEFRLEPGDYALLYTDGATEALDAEGEEFGTERLVRSLQSAATGSAAHVIQRLTEDLKTFVGNYPQHDDITLIAIRKR